MEIPAFSFQVTPKLTEPTNTDFWKKEWDVQSTWTQKMKGKVAEPEKRRKIISLACRELRAKKASRNKGRN